MDIDMSLNRLATCSSNCGIRFQMKVPFSRSVSQSSLLENITKSQMKLKKNPFLSILFEPPCDSKSLALGDV